MNGLNYFDILRLAMPETIVVIAAFAVLGIDLLVMRGAERWYRFAIAATISTIGCLAAGLWLLNSHEQVSILNGMLVIDPLTKWAKIGVLVLTIATVVVSLESKFTSHVGEYFALILFATVGMMLMAGTEELLMLFLALEMTSLSLYVLTAFHKESSASAEAALKYFLIGGMSAAFTLFGLSLIYGLAGSTQLRHIAAALHGPALDPMLAVALVMTVIGFGFKIAAVPFHLWAPDVYQGAPTSVAAFVASGSKLASFFLFAKVMMIGFAGVEGSGGLGTFIPGWVPLLAAVAFFSMLLGNLGAIVQVNVKRLLAYSAIAHGGYALLGIMSNNPTGTAALLYYALTYGLTIIGAFAVVAAVEGATGNSSLATFAGLGRRSPWLSACMLIFMLSLAGIPPLAGFFGKFFLFTGALRAEGGNLGLFWLVIFAILISTVSLYYYLQVLKQIYVTESPANTKLMTVPLSTKIVVGALAAGVVIFGCAPDLLISHLVSAIKVAAW